MSRRAEAVLADGRRIPYIITDNPPQGGMKYTYFAPDRSYVVQFFHDPDIVDEALRDRLTAIIGRYNPTCSEEAGGAKKSGEAVEEVSTVWGAATPSAVAASSALKRSSRPSGPPASSEDAEGPVLVAVMKFFPYPAHGGACCGVWGRAACPPLLPHRAHHTRPAPWRPKGTTAADGLHAQTHGLPPVAPASAGDLAGSERGSQMRIAPAPKPRGGVRRQGPSDPRDAQCHT